MYLQMNIITLSRALARGIRKKVVGFSRLYSSRSFESRRGRRGRRGHRGLHVKEISSSREKRGYKSKSSHASDAT